MQAIPPSIEPEGIFDGLRWSAILLGAVLDNVLTNLAILPLLVLFGPAEVFSNDSQAVERAIEEVSLSGAFLLCSFAVGFAITTYASHWGAHRAGVHFLRHGGWVAVASTVMALLLGLLIGGSAEPQPPLWYTALGFAAVLPAGLLGGWIAAKRAPTGSGSGP